MTEATPAAAAETPAHTQSSTAETPALNIPAPEADTQETTQQPAAETQDNGTPEPNEDGTPDGNQEDESKKRNKVSAKERISQLTAQRNEAEMRARAAEAELHRLRQPLTPPGPGAGQDEFERYNARTAVREERAEEVAEAVRAATSQAMHATFATFEAKASAVADRMPDLVEKFVALPVVSKEVAQFVADSDVGAEVAYYMTQNPNEAARISRLPSYQQGIELARVESRISAVRPRKNTTAPPPPPKMQGAPSVTAKDPGSMSMDEYKAWYKARQKA